MKIIKSFLLIVSSILLLASCSYFQSPLARFNPLTEGEARLTGIQMPDNVREDLVYDVILIVDSEEMPQVKRVCFRWLSEQILSVSPSLNCFAAEGDFGTGNPCNYSTSNITPGSNTFCVEASDIKTDVPGRILVKLRAANLQASYTVLEAQAEYVQGGQVKTTNAVKTSVAVDMQ